MADRSCKPPCTKPQSLCTEAGVCGCEEGYTEVMTSDGLLDQCTVIPVLEIPTADDNKADVKTIRAFNPTQPAVSPPGRAGRTWFLQPFGPDGKLKTWVYGVAAGAFVLLVFIISMTYLACCCGRCLCCKSSSKSPSGRAYWMEQNSYTVPYTCPACQKLEQEELKRCNEQQQQQQQKQQQYEAQLLKPPSSQQHPQPQQSLPHPAPPFETLIT